LNLNNQPKHTNDMSKPQQLTQYVTLEVESRDDINVIEVEVSWKYMYDPGDYWTPPYSEDYDWEFKVEDVRVFDGPENEISYNPGDEQWEWAKGYILSREIEDELAEIAGNRV